MKRADPVRSKKGRTSVPRPRGRPRGPKVPCDDCIRRASVPQGSQNELCERCRSLLGRTNPQPATSKTGSLRPQSHAIVDTVLGLGMDDALPLYSENDAEQSILTFCVTHTLPHLAEHFGSPFWLYAVMRAAAVNPTVRYALITVGAFHQELRVQSRVAAAAEPAIAWMLVRCEESIKQITSLGNEDPETRLCLHLSASILATCVDILRGHALQASHHCTRAYHLLIAHASDINTSTWDLESNRDFNTRLQSIKRCFALSSTNSSIPELQLSGMAVRELHYQRNLSQARAQLAVMWDWLVVAFLEADLNDSIFEALALTGQINPGLVTWVEWWSTAFAELLERMGPSMTANERRTAAILKAHYLVVELLSTVDHTLQERGWAQLRGKMDAVVDLAALVIDEEVPRNLQPSVSGPGSHPDKLYDLAITDPLFEICVRCQDESLRTKALDLIKRSDRPQFTRNAYSAWKVEKFLLGLSNTQTESAPKSSPSEQTSIGQTFGEQPTTSSQAQTTGTLVDVWSQHFRNPRFALNPGLIAAMEGGSKTSHAMAS